ncbi:MAG: hypothetical protein WCQ95_05560 [Bacteroidota bacterium]
MEDLSVLLSGVEYKILQLVKIISALRKENIEINNKLLEQSNINNDNNLKIKYLEEKNTILKITNSIDGEENKTKAKLKINELLREVERCLALLNK